MANKERRFSVCKVCRKKWNISIYQDTSRGYICPYCWGKRRRDDGEEGIKESPLPISEWSNDDDSE
jgi:hypothetical protein